MDQTTKKPHGQLLRELFLAFIRRDDDQFRVAAKAVISDERSKNHRLLAADLERILVSEQTSRSLGVLYQVPKDRERGLPLLEVSQPEEVEWERLIARPSTLHGLAQIAEEHDRADLLATAGLRPKNKLLFYGPPGCGKTLAARVMSSMLDYPLVTVRFDGLISSYLGETAANLAKVFDFVARGRWVILFDEFDAIGKDRSNTSEHGELKRVVNVLLQTMDNFKGSSLLIAATNHEDLLDTAVWRRFEGIFHFPLPTTQERHDMLQRFLKGFGGSALRLQPIATKMVGASGSDVEWVSIEAARRAVLAGRVSVDARDLDAAVTDWRQHFRPVRMARSVDN